jgi:N-acetylglucosamine kinase-like BadF-type ATPase
MSAFLKQADGRLPKTPLYTIFREHFGITKDLYFVEEANSDLGQEKGRFAKMQLLAEKAHKEGDQTMTALYQEAAEKLSVMVRAVRDQLRFDDGKPVRVSYSGGLFKAGELVLAPFRQRIDEMGMVMITPGYSPIIGAAALAAVSLSPADLELMLKNIHNTITRELLL